MNGHSGIRFRLVTVLLVLALLAGCDKPVPRQETLPRESGAKYVFLFIGDGMGLAQTHLTEAYLAAIHETQDETPPPPGAEGLTFTRFPVTGLFTNYTTNHQTTDSAAAATAMATGHKTSRGTISMDPTGKQSYVTIAELAKAAGMKVGIVSTSSINDATPAAFYAHHPTRKDFHEIAHQVPTSKVDYFAGSGLSQSKGPLGNAIELAVQNGFKLVTTPQELAECQRGERVLFQGWVPYAIDRPDDRVTLVEMTQKGIELLENPNGFFMMIESARIDGAGHTNDVRPLVAEVAALDVAVRAAVKFYQKHPLETLIVVTSDHETGGLTLGSRGPRPKRGLANIQLQKKSWRVFNKEVLVPFKESHSWSSAEDDIPDDLKVAIRDFFGLNYDLLSVAHTKRIEDAYDASMYAPKKRNPNYKHPLYGRNNPLSLVSAQIVAERAGVTWTSSSHTFVPIPVYALGVSAHRFDGYYDNTDIARKLAEAMGLTIPGNVEAAVSNAN